MAIGRSYPYDNKIQDTDLFLGTKSSNLTTVNYTAQAVADYLNTQGKISIGGQMVFKFVTVNPLAGTISFPTLGGNNTPFSAITNLIVSVADLSAQNVVNFISYIVGSEILLTEQNQVSTFGNYKITAYAITANPNFYDLTVEYIGGYGSIVENTYYDLSFFREPASAPVITPNLNDVLLEGNTSLLDAKIGSLYLYDTTAADYARVDITNDIFTVNLASNNPLFQNGIGVSRVWNSIGVEGVIDYSLLTGGRIYSAPDASGTIALLSDIPTQGLTSVGLSMPAAFNVANSPLTSDGTIAVSAAGTSSQYIRGDGQLATLPSGGGGGSSVNYYLNGSISASVAGYKQLSNTAIIGGGTDFPLTGNGLIAEFLTDAGNPNRIEIPGGAWNFEMWFSMSSNGGTPKFYVELLKYNGTTFTTIANNSAVPETIDGGTVIDLYLTSLAVPTTTLLSTDRLAIRVYIVDNSGGRTATLHTEDNHLCEILTTFSGGVTSLNGLTANTQYLTVGTTGTDFNISSVSETHTFNLPTASATNRGALSTTDWTAFNGKFNLPSLTSGSVLFSNGTTIAQDNSNFFFDDTNNRLGIGTNVPNSPLTINVNSAVNSITGINLVGGSDTAGKVISISRHFSVSNNYTESRIDFGTETANSGQSFLAFATGNANGNNPEAMRLSSLRNLLINTTVDQGGKLQIKAPGALSTDIALRVRNSADTGDLMIVSGSGNMSFKTTNSNTNGTILFTNNNSVATIAAATDTGSALTMLQFRGAGYNFTDLGTNGFVIQSTGYGTSATPTAILQVDSTTKGFLPPRMTTTQKNSIATPASGLVVYDTTLGVLSQYDGVSWNAYQKQVALTSGSVLFSDGTTIAQKNSNFFWDNTNNRLGIGNAAPEVTLDVTGIGRITNGIRLNNVGIAYGPWGQNPLEIGTNGSHFIIQATNGGNTSFGSTVNLGAKVGIKAPGALSTDIALRVRNSADTKDLMTFDGTGKLTLSTPTTNTLSIQGSGNGDITISSTAYGPMITTTGSVYAFSQWGNTVQFKVGSGGAADRIGYPMQFYSGISTGNTNGGDFQFFSSLSGTAGSSTPNTANEVFRIKNNGNVLINTTTDNGGKLQIKAPGALSTDIALRVRNSADSADLVTIGGTGILTVGGVGNDGTINLARGSNGAMLGAIIQRADFTEFYNYQGSGIRFFVTGATPLVRAFITTRGLGITGTTGGGFTLDASALLQGDSTTQGFLPPRMTNAQRIAIATPAVGLCVYCTDVVEGLYINKSTGWTYIG